MPIPDSASAPFPREDPAHGLRGALQPTGQQAQEESTRQQAMGRSEDKWEGEMVRRAGGCRLIAILPGTGRSPSRGPPTDIQVV